MQPAPIRVKPRGTLKDEWLVELQRGVCVVWTPDDFTDHGLTPPEPPLPPVTLTVELTAKEAEALERNVFRADFDSTDRYETYVSAARKVEAALREQREATNGE
jgi:hypothetical protein